MPKVPKSHWDGFLTSLALEKRLEFNQGDVGISGGLQVLEPANANPTTVDMIKRFGGSTSVTTQWPEEEQVDEEDRVERMEKLIQRTLQRVVKRNGSGGGSTKQSGTRESGSQQESGEHSQGS